jgi:copper resistance protein D
VHFAATLSLGGVPAFWTLIAAPARRAAEVGATGLGDLRRPLRWLAWASLGVAIVSGAAWLTLEAASMSERSVLDAMTGGALATTLMHTQFGGATWARLIAFAVIAAGLELGRRGSMRHAPYLDAVLVGFGAVAVASIAWTGHAGASEGLIGCFQLADDALHLVAAGAWLGSLIPLALLLRHARRKSGPEWATAAREATRRFSIVGIVSVATLLVTGIVNTWFLSGSIPALVGTEYGRLLLLKIGLFLAMVGVATINRVRLTPRLSHVPRGSKTHANADALRRLARNSLIEIGLGMGVLLAVGALGTLPPGLHAEPSWPLPFRFPMEDSEAGPAIATRIMALILGLAFMAASFVFRRAVREFRAPLFATGLLLALYEIVHLATLAVPAYPTSYIASPTGYTVASVARADESRSRRIARPAMERPVAATAPLPGRCRSRTAIAGHSHLH